MSKFSSRSIRTALLGGISLAAFVAAPAWAQTSGEAIETVTITGSRVITDVTMSPTAITQVTV